ncbi:MAG: hypothetical protein J7K46_06615 [Bacteroidales bacterium]|nr:hypothetical protein [Bacteroidales bacterium]
MKDYSTFHLHFSGQKQPHGSPALEEEKEAEAEMDRVLARILGPEVSIKVPEVVLGRLFFRMRLLSQRYRN